MNPITLRDCETVRGSGPLSLEVELGIACEHYFQLGSRQVYPIWGQENNKLIFLKSRQYSPPFLITALKILSYVLLIFPLIFGLILFCTRRSHYQFESLQETFQNFSPKQYKALTFNYNKAPNQSGSNEIIDSSEVCYFHATSEAGLQGILKDRQIQVMHRQAYRGAFVSTRPEIRYGSCVIGFKRTIEKIQRIATSGYMSNSYWIGFNQSIPLLPETLAFIAVPPHILDANRLTLPSELQDIPLIPVEPGELVQALSSTNPRILIPLEWPSDCLRSRAI